MPITIKTVIYTPDDSSVPNAHLNRKGMAGTMIQTDALSNFGKSFYCVINEDFNSNSAIKPTFCSFFSQSQGHICKAFRYHFASAPPADIIISISKFYSICPKDLLSIKKLWQHICFVLLHLKFDRKTFRDSL